MVTALKRPKLKKPAADQWQCKCGVLNPQSEPRCHACKAIANPRTAPAKSQRLTWSTTEWRCPECDGVTPEPQPSCNVCQLVTNPRLTPQQRQLAIVLEPTQSRADAWLDLAKQPDGVGSLVLEIMIRETLGRDGTCTAGDAPVCWRLMQTEVNVWFGKKEPKGPPDLYGDNLVDAVRGIYQIPAPKEKPAADGKKSITPAGRRTAAKALDSLGEAAGPVSKAEEQLIDMGLLSPRPSKNGKHPPASTSSSSPAAGVASEIPLERIERSTKNPRKAFDQEALERLPANGDCAPPGWPD